MSASPGEILGWVTGTATLIIAAWTLFGKNKQDSFSRIQVELTRLDTENKSLKAQIDTLKEKLSACEDMKHRYQVMVEFLGDILSNAYPLD